MLTSSRAAKSVGLSKKTLNTLAKKGLIPSIVLPSGHRRFDIEEIKAALSAEGAAGAAGGVEPRGAANQSQSDGSDK